MTPADLPARRAGSICGAELFASYAYPPNALGYCGPDDASVLLARGADARADLARHAQQFDGAWVYLELIAEAAGAADPLDPRVVEAYWIGNDLLDLLDPDTVAESIRARLPAQSGASYFPGAAHHGYHVFAVYPWVSILAGNPAAAKAVEILDQCRITAAEVVAVGQEHARVTYRPLTLSEGALTLGPLVEADVAVAVRGTPLLPDLRHDGAGLRLGDTVALHWSWVCDVLTAEQTACLTRLTVDQLDAANTVLHAGG